MTAVLDLLTALTDGTFGVFGVLFEHLGGFLGAVGELVEGSSAAEVEALPEA